MRLHEALRAQRSASPRPQVLGEWTFYLTEPTETRTSCGHLRPDVRPRGSGAGLQSTQIGKAMIDVFCGAIIRNIS